MILHYIYIYISGHSHLYHINAQIYNEAFQQNKNIIFNKKFIVRITRYISYVHFIRQLLLNSQGQKIPSRIVLDNVYI